MPTDDDDVDDDVGDTKAITIGRNFNNRQKITGGAFLPSQDRNMFSSLRLMHSSRCGG